MPEHPAHVVIEKNGLRRVHTAARHSRETAGYASESLAALGLWSAGYLAGLVHDMGKFTAKYAQYIEKAARGEKVVRGSVNHTFAGVIYLFERYRTAHVSKANYACEFIGYAVGAHHGLFDCFGRDGADGFEHRLVKDKEEICYDEAVGNFLAECAGEEELDNLFVKAEEELDAFVRRLISQSSGSASFSFYVGMTARVILSALIDADRKSTAEFMTWKARPTASRDMQPIWELTLSNLERRLAGLPSEGEINTARRKISEVCKDFAGKPGGIYRLTVPTGSGKTLSSLRYALSHALSYNKRRVVYAAPLLSILEQNANEWRKGIGNKYLLLEHHSNIVKTDFSEDELDWHRLLAEDWGAPVVVTTFVQLLDTLFSGAPACVRRMRALCGSVLIIDEIQSLPVKMVSQANEAFNFLSQFCGVTIVLCSATQPCLVRTPHPLKALGEEIVPYNDELWEVFRRNRVVDLCRPEGYTVSEMAELILEKLEGKDSLLFICNTRKTARDVYRALDILNRNLSDPFLLYHLSAAMCKAHRADTLDAIRANLRKRRVVCVATQLVEAGVDISFECVMRVKAGLDSVAQAAGRCNRSREYAGICDVYIVNAKDERLGPLREIECAQSAAGRVLYDNACGLLEDGDLLSEKAVASYYGYLYKDPKIQSRFDYPLPELDSNMFDLLSVNMLFRSGAKEPGKHLVCQAFETAGRHFCVFDEGTADVVVPYNEEAEDVIADLCSAEAEKNLNFFGKALERARPYTVSLYGYQLRMLEDSGGLYGGKDGAFIAVRPGFYDKAVGIEIGEDRQKII